MKQEARAEPEPDGPASRRTNSEFPWHAFDSRDYHRRNYASVLEVDRLFAQDVAAYFAAEAGDEPRLGLDVGAGPNLYPALAMLPFCKTVDMVEFAPTNCAWLRAEVAGYAPTWDPFWEIIAAAGGRPYEDVADPRGRLAALARVRQGSIFDLPEARWNLGTMFFVAESISRELTEFGRALDAFLGALEPGSPFAAGFMEGSKGYPVGGIEYPAVDITLEWLEERLADRVTGPPFRYVEAEGDHAVRDGHTGMILVRGKTK